MQRLALIADAFGRHSIFAFATRLHDAKAVLVTFSSVRAHRSDSDWTVVPFINAATSGPVI
jgi:hypothetical protein